jgi:2-iminoacetate synthase
VSDDDFKKIVAVIRLALPYTGIILSTGKAKRSAPSFLITG